MNPYNMPRPSLDRAIERILEKDKRYAADAYRFVNDAVHFTVKSLRKNGIKGGDNPHVTGQELLQGIRRYALDQYGPMAHALFEFWGVRASEDFGELVFNLVDAGMLGLNATDSREDFKGAYSFEDAFLKPFRPERPIALSGDRPRRRVTRKGRGRAGAGDAAESPSPSSNA
jgi:uncharacterized repeat protein (TIGR04138 family)